MDQVPKVSIKSLCVGDVLSGQDGNKYVVCKNANVLYWEPYETPTVMQVTVNVSVPIASPCKPIKKVKEVREKYHWKDNHKKPSIDDYNKWTEMKKSLKPKVSPNKFPVGYVWTTNFNSISYVVDTGYEGSSTTLSKFWNVVGICPPCLDANDYPFEYVSGLYYVDYDEQGNKFWSDRYSSGKDCPLQQPYKFIEGTTCTISDSSTYVSVRCDGSAYWKKF